jgi:hypothetical protein
MKIRHKYSVSAVRRENFEDNFAAEIILAGGKN